MDFARKSFDEFYDFIKPVIFRATQNDPRVARDSFVKFCRYLYSLDLDKFVFDNETNRLNPGFEISNAAGFNKNGHLPPRVLGYLGFDRTVIGTVTHDKWPGNSGKTIRRFNETGSMINREGLPGDGSKAIAERLNNYDDDGIFLTINFMSTPGKKGDKLLRDLEGTMRDTRDLLYVDRFELNISCPNTHDNTGKDLRKENLKMLRDMTCVVRENIHPDQDIYFKVSPDSTEADVDDTLEAINSFMLDDISALIDREYGVVTCNTTTNHNRVYIPKSFRIKGKQEGGASGNAVYKDSLKVQKLYERGAEQLILPLKIIPCGGINSLTRLNERLELDKDKRNYLIDELQIYTPFIFSGPKLLREFREFS